MAATVVAVQESSGKYAVPGAGEADITFEALDASSGGYFINTGKEMVLVNNTDASPQTFTITSTPLAGTAREGSISAYSLAAGDFALFGPLPIDGWALSSDFKTYMSASDVAVEVAVIRPSLS